MELMVFLAMLAGLTYRIFADAGPQDEKIKELQDKLLELNERAQVLQATADAEKRSLKEDEEKELNGIFDQFEKIEEEIERRKLIASQTQKLTQSQGRQTAGQIPDPQNRGTDGQDPPPPRRRSSGGIITVVEDRGKWGWKNLGEFALATRIASRQGGSIDPRLVMNAPTTYSQEGAGEDGGFAVPPDFRAAIWEKVQGEDSLLARTDQNVTSKNSMVLPADETTPWDATGGIQAYFESEAGALNQSKIALKEKTIRLNKLTALVPVTEELLEDAPGLDSYLRKKVGEKMDFKLNLKIVQGVGAGEPLGILNAGSLVSISKETGQGADTIMAENISKMWARLYAPLRRNAVWLINQDIEPQLDSMSIAVGTGGVPVYMPAGGLADAPFGRLKGRPVIPTQACETLGDKGDIILVALEQYLTAVKTGGVKADVSMHLWFDYAVLAYRFIIRIAGQPWWKSYITPRDGSNYLSWAVTLDERA
jgi:HK97 family phage major capsid protein